MIDFDRLDSRVANASRFNREDKNALTWLQYELKEIVADIIKYSQYEISYCKMLLEKVEKALSRC